MGQTKQPCQSGQQGQQCQQGAGVIEFFGQTEQEKELDFFGQKKQKNKKTSNKSIFAFNNPIHLDTIVYMLLFYILSSQDAYKYTRQFGFKQNQILIHSLIFGLLYFLKNKYYD